MFLHVHACVPVTKSIQYMYTVHVHVHMHACIIKQSAEHEGERRGRLTEGVLARTASSSTLQRALLSAMVTPPGGRAFIASTAILRERERERGREGERERGREGECTCYDVLYLVHVCCGYSYGSTAVESIVHEHVQ